MQRPNKRLHPRVHCRIEAIGRRIDQSATKGLWETTVNHISEGGIRFRLNEMLPVQSKFLIKLNIPHSKPLEIVSRPTWVKELPQISQYETGAQFVGLSGEDRKLLRKYIHSLPAS